MKSIVTISRYWDNPKITTTISEDGISLTISMNDFIEALKEDMGSITWVFTKSEFEKRLDIAIKNILDKIKEESIKII